MKTWDVVRIALQRESAWVVARVGCGEGNNYHLPLPGRFVEKAKRSFPARSSAQRYDIGLWGVGLVKG